MNKRIKNKIQKQIWESPIVILKRYHCDECKKDFLAQVHKKMMKESLVYLENNKIFCPICKKELKLTKQTEDVIQSNGYNNNTEY